MAAKDQLVYLGITFLQDPNSEAPQNTRQRESPRGNTSSVNQFVCTACGKRGAEIRGKFPAAHMGVGYDLTPAFRIGDKDLADRASREGTPVFNLGLSN
jgi:hypothetical protein